MRSVVRSLTRAAVASLLAFALLSRGGALSAATIRVAAGGDLQQALTNAQPGDVILLDKAATFTGNFTLPQKSGSDFITLKTDLGADVPAGRVTTADDFATLRSPNSAPALQTAPGAHHWRIEEIELTGAGSADVVELGDGSSAQTSLAAVPHDLVLDRLYVHGDAERGVKRCIALNSASTVISNSYVSDCKAIGADAQAIAGWNGPGPFTIVNNYLEGSTENILFGGSDPSIPNLVPTDITIRGNQLSKPPAWRSERWQVKNLLELKNARNVTIDRNTLEYNWKAAQTGFAVLFTVRNQDGKCEWCQVEQVAFTNNVVRHSSAGIQILGKDNVHPSLQTQAVVIRNNVFLDIDPKAWGGNGYAFLLAGEPRDVTIDHNTIVQDNHSGVIQADGRPILGFTFTNNLAVAGTYGIIGTDHAPGNDTISFYFPASLFAGNVLAGADAARFPSRNRYPPLSDFVKQFVSFVDGDLRLVSGSAFRGSATDGTDIGAVMTRVVRPPIDERPTAPRRPKGG
jgi:hypothetical protein